MFGDENSDDEDGGLKEFEDVEDSMSLLLSRPKNSGVLAFHKGTEEGMFLYLERYRAAISNSKTSLSSSLSPSSSSPGEGNSNVVFDSTANSEGGREIRNDIINADDCLRLIDKYCYSRHWMMHIGNQKLPFLEKGVQRAKQNTPPGQRLICLEIGSYCGYSTVAIAKNLKEGDMLICIECEDSCARWTNRMLQLTGLDTKVRIITSSFALPECVPALITCISSVNNNSSIKAIGAVFIDHDKKRYLQDLRICESLDIMIPGCVVIADNVLSFGEPLSDYLSHVRDNTIYESSEIHESFIEYAVAMDDVDIRPELRDTGQALSLIDGVEVSIYKGGY
jgi:catechol O-methyltransferase